MYLESIQKAVDYIEENLGGALRLDKIASVSGYSMFHFDRLFKYMTDESVIEYVRKRRLSEAANELVKTDCRIIEIALKYGFESQQAFTTAFKKYYHNAPGKYRMSGKNLVLLERKVITEADLRQVSAFVETPPRFEVKSAFTVIGLLYHGANQNGEIPRLWQQFSEASHLIKSRVNNGVSLGICEHVPDYDPEVSEFFYLACTEVKTSVITDDQIEAGFVMKHYPEQAYVVFTHRGSTDTLGDTYRYIYGTYFCRAKVDLSEAPDFERYDERFTNGVDSIMEIYIPVRMDEISTSACNAPNPKL